MSNYQVTGRLNRAVVELDAASTSIMHAAPDSADGKLYGRIRRAIRTVESIHKQASKLIQARPHPSWAGSGVLHELRRDVGCGEAPQ